MNLAKYAFDNKEQSENKINALYSEDDKGRLIPKHNFEVIVLGCICLEDEVIDIDGNVTSAVFSDKYHVDMIWHELETHPFGWKSYYVDVDGNGSHSIAGENYNDYKF